MTKYLLLASLFLFASIPGAQAEILILKGTANSSLGTSAGTEKQLQKAYFIYDRPAALGRVIFVSVKRKTVIDAGARFYGFSQVKRGTKFYDFLVTANGSFSNNNSNFSASQIYLKGAEASLFVSSSTAAFSFPRTLTGLLTNISNTGNAGGSVATVASLVLGFDGPTTRAANTANQTAFQASQNLRGSFVAKGYTDLNPNVQ